MLAGRRCEYGEFTGNPSATPCPGGYALRRKLMLPPQPTQNEVLVSTVFPLCREELENYLVSPEFVAHPYTTLRQMREEIPVYWSDSVGGWIITRYDDVMTTFKHTKDYSNEGRLGRAAVHVP